MSTLTLKLPKPHSDQALIKSEAARFNVVACGRRWGKTILGQDLIIEPALQGIPTAWFAPTSGYYHEPWAEISSVLNPIIKRLSLQERKIDLITGGSIKFWSLENPDAGRGHKYGRIVVDETAMVRTLEYSWNNALRPTLADLKGDAWFLSTPKGRDFFWQLFTRGQDPSNILWRSWQRPSWNNHHVDRAEFLAIQDQIPERAWRQEILAEFIEGGGGVFRGVDLAVDQGRGSNSEPKAETFYAAGVDLARVEDFTIIDVLDQSGKQVYFERFNQISWERQIAAIVRVAEHYKAPIVLDTTGVGDPIYEAIRKSGVQVIPFYFTNASKEQLIDHLAIKIENGSLSLMDIPVQTNELLAYQYELTAKGNTRMSAPVGMHDDTVIALALAAWGIAKNIPSNNHRRSFIGKSGGYV